jgi:SAM-dependent methyltransferase
MKADTVYAAHEIHDRWQTAYRQGPGQDALNERIIERLLAHLRPPADALILDAGCGTGNHLFRFARRGYSCVGVDLSDYALRQARQVMDGADFASRVTLSCQSLEALSFADNTFDVVHCRGVLMHIAAWEEALRELCRVLKPGGRIAIFESNHRGVAAYLQRWARLLRKNKSLARDTPGGIEYWGDLNGERCLVRVAKIDHLCARLRDRGVKVLTKFGTEFWDLNQFPAVLRGTALRFNRLWFELRLPAFFSIGNGVIGVKE